jgi:hypothetical protein
MDVRYQSNFLLLAVTMQLLVLTLPALAFAQDCTPREIELTSQLEVDQFQANHGPCDRVSQNLVITGEDIVRLNGLSDLTAVLGELKIDYNSSLITIDGLAKLQSVGSLSMSFNPALLKIDGLSGLTRVDGWLLIQYNDSLQSVSGLNQLAYVGDNLLVRVNRQLTRLHGLSKLYQVDGALRFSLNSLVDLDGFSSLTSVGGLDIKGEGLLTDLGGLSNLTDVMGDLYIYGNGLITIDGLSALARVGGDLWLLQNMHLSSCMGITRLVDQIDDADPGPGVGVAPDVGGAILIEQNAIGCNSVEEILAEEPLLEMNAGLNDAWFNSGADGQGFLIIVYPQIEQIFLAWFTYDIVRPPMDVTASVGEPGHRWLTAQGPFVNNRASLTLYNTSGGIFDSAEPVPSSQPDGTIVLEFSSCSRGIVTYDIDSIGWQGLISIERIALDNIALCEALNGQ